MGEELPAAGPNSPAEDYYHHWLAALEKLLEEKNIVSKTQRLNTQLAWDKAARATPHGEPIILGRDEP